MKSSLLLPLLDLDGLSLCGSDSLLVLDKQLLPLSQQMREPVLRTFHVFLQVRSFCSDAIQLDMTFFLRIADGLIDIATLQAIFTTLAVSASRVSRNSVVVRLILTLVRAGNR